MNKINSIFVAIGLLFLTGCFKSNPIDTVKNGFLKSDKSITIGQAFDAWKECDNKQWSTETMENGRTLVDFSCNLNDVRTKLQFMLKNGDITEEHFSYLQFQNVLFDVKWVINADKETFNLDDAYVTYVWNKNLQEKVILDENNFIDIYKNKPFSIHDNLAKSTFNTLALKYYLQYKVVLDLEKEAKHADKIFSNEKSKILKYFKKTDKEYIVVKHSDTVKDLYYGLQSLGIEDTGTRYIDYFISILPL